MYESAGSVNRCLCGPAYDVSRCCGLGAGGLLDTVSGLYDTDAELLPGATLKKDTEKT